MLSRGWGWRAMNRGAAVVRPHLNIGEEAARGRLGAFIATGIADYAEARDDLGRNGTSNLSENLTYGEMSARTCWWAGLRAMEEGKPGAETFLKELVWRDFAHHLVYHTPHIVDRNWREEWDAFPWNDRRRAQGGADLEKGAHGHGDRRCGDARDVCHGPDAQPRADAGGLLPDQAPDDPLEDRHGLVRGLPRGLGPGLERDGLAMVGGVRARRAPYFRVFNPETQAEKFDADGAIAAGGWRNCPPSRPKAR
jgi:deoxyribodipyrimidine photo-lyase